MKNGTFYKILDDTRWKFWLDHHTIYSHNYCERFFNFRHNYHLRAKGMKPALSIGSWWSSTMEYLYKDIAVGKISRDSFLQQAAQAWDACYFCKHPSSKHGPTIVEGGETHICCIEDGCTCTQFLNMESMKTANPKGYERFKGISGAILMATQYYDFYAEHDARHWKILGAEVGFGLKEEVLLAENDKVIVFYVGKPDLVVFEPQTDTVQPLDHKTVDRVPYNVQRNYKPHPQTAGYIFAVDLLTRELGISRKRVDRCVINVAARMPPAEKPKDGKIKPRFVRVYPNYAEEEIEEFRHDVLGKATRLRYSIEHQEWNPKESSCHLYNGCDYLEICSKPPAIRDLVIKTDFIQIAPWVPYEVDTEEA
jgi:hypothetical protein